MATLSELQRVEAWADLMKKWSRDGETVGIEKAELRAAVDAMDDFFDANTATINNAFPAAAKAGLTTQQKALLLMYVITKRYILEG